MKDCDGGGSLDVRLVSIVQLVAKALPSMGLEPRGQSLVRETPAGVAQAVYFYVGPGGPIGPRGPENDGRWFLGLLGARLTSSTSALTRVLYPEELRWDVSVTIGDPKRVGSEPSFLLDDPAESVSQIVDLLEPHGRRWFAKYESVDRALESLDELPPSDDARTGQFPGLLAARLRAERGELDAAQRSLDGFVGSRDNWPVLYIERLTPKVQSLGLTMPKPVEFSRRWSLFPDVDGDRPAHFRDQPDPST